MSNNTENQNTDNDREVQNGINNPGEVAVIDIPEETRETGKEKTKTRKHVNIFKQFLIPKVYTTAIVAYLAYLALNILYTIIISSLFDIKKVEDNTNQQELENLLKSKSTYLILMVCIIGPIYEEFIFRSFIFKLINWFGKKVQEKAKFIGIIIRILAFVISSFLFAFGHFSFSFDTLKKEFITFPIYFLMGITFALAYDRDGYLLASILTHALNNTISLLAIYYLPQDVSVSVDLIKYYIINYI